MDLGIISSIPAGLFNQRVDLMLDTGRGSTASAIGEPMPDLLALNGFLHGFQILLMKPRSRTRASRVIVHDR